MAELLMDADWERLLGRLDRFNPFRILRTADNEIRHSNVLAWLFNPEGNHGLGDAFLRKFLLSLARDLDTGIALQDWPTVLEVLDMPLGDVQVFRERDHIDLQVVIEVLPKRGFVLLIENKWHSGERAGQLNQYLQITRERYPGFRILPVFLTLQGQDPSDPSYVATTHEKCSLLIRDILQVKADRIPQNVQDFLAQYIEIIEEKMQMDDETVRLARKLFSQHEDAIRLIYDIGMRRSLAEPWKLFLEQVSGEALGIQDLWGTQTGWIPFNLPCQRGQNVSSKEWGRGMATSWWVCIHGADQLKMALEVGPWDDPGQRLAFLEHLSRHLAVKGRIQAGGTYTRLATETIGGIKSWDDAQDVATKMTKLWEKLQPSWVKYQEASTVFFKQQAMSQQ